MRDQAALPLPACHGYVSGGWCMRTDDGSGLHEEGPQRLLEGSDRTGCSGEGGAEMGEDLCRRPLPRWCWQLGRRAASPQCRADLALAAVEPFPEALPGAVAPL